jgi:hypothetical protein
VAAPAAAGKRGAKARRGRPEAKREAEAISPDPIKIQILKRPSLIAREMAASSFRSHIFRASW